MLYQCHCACCERAVEAGQKQCSHCGSHTIKSPYSFWMCCILACLAAVIVFKVVHVYLQDHQEMPVQQSLLDILNQNNKSGR